MNAAYLLFKLKGWDPRRYYRMDEGARLVVRAFLHQEIGERKRELEDMRKG